jgi:hypothetical protein
VTRAVVLALLAFTSIVVLATARELSIGQAESSAADAAADAADWPEAIARARAAAEAYVPGSPWPERGMRRLAVVGHGAEARGDEPAALLAYGAMRTAAVATRVPYGTTSHWLADANEGLARVAAAHEDVAHAPAAAQAMLDALRRDQGPGDAALVVLAFSAAATLGGLSALAFGPVGPRAVVARVVAAGGFVAYAAVVLTS